MDRSKIIQPHILQHEVSLVWWFQIGSCDEIKPQMHGCKKQGLQMLSNFDQKRLPEPPAQVS